MPSLNIEFEKKLKNEQVEKGNILTKKQKEIQLIYISKKFNFIYLRVTLFEIHHFGGKRRFF